MEKFQINIDGSVFPVLHNPQGKNIYLNCPKHTAEGTTVNLEVWLWDMKLPPHNSLIKVIKGHLDLRENKAAQVFNRFTKRWCKHIVPRLYVMEYEVLGQNPEIVTIEKTKEETEEEA